MYATMFYYLLRSFNVYFRTVLKKKNFREFYAYVYACMNVCDCNVPEQVGALQRLVSERTVPLLPIHSLPAIATIIVSYFLLFIYCCYALINCFAIT